MSSTKVLICRPAKADEENKEGEFVFMEVEPVDSKDHLKHGWSLASDVPEAAGVIAARKIAEETQAQVETKTEVKTVSKKKGSDAPLPGDASVAGG